MPTCICIGGLLLLADGAAWVLTAETGDSRWGVLITSGTALLVAACTAFVIAAPHIGKAVTAFSNVVITAILPALAIIRKQNEELNKGTLSERIETLMAQNVKLQATIEEDRARTEDANKKLHEIRNEFQVATFQHREQREALIAELAALKASLKESQAKIDDLKEHDSRALRGVKIEQVQQAVKQAHQDAAISENTAAIQVTAAVAEKTAAAVEQINVEREAERSGEVPAVEPPSDERS